MSAPGGPGLLSRFLKSQLSPAIVVRSAPQNWQRFLRRCALATAGLLLSVAVLAEFGLPSPWFYFPAYIVAVMGLEYLAGSLFMAACYAVPAGVMALLAWFAPAMMPREWLLYAGLIGCAGALSRFLKYGPIFTVLILAALEGLIYHAAGDLSPRMVFPPLAIALGFVAARTLLRGD